MEVLRNEERPKKGIRERKQILGSAGVKLE